MYYVETFGPNDEREIRIMKEEAQIDYLRQLADEEGFEVLQVFSDNPQDDYGDVVYESRVPQAGERGSD
jgi:hypothetical protein